MSEQKERDDFTGTETTGHEWDGIKELNTPLPRWWVWVFLITVIWSVGYMWVYPAWPLLSDYTHGSENWSSREAVMQDVAKGREARAGMEARVLAATFDEIRADNELSDFAYRGGRSAFGLFCAQCHGSGAQGAEGIANLNDDVWIWGGDIDAIEGTIRYGVRSDHLDSRYAMMPAFGDGMLDDGQIGATADYVLALGDGSATADMAGADVYMEQCAMCHGDSGEGLVEMGGPRLSDGIWLYAGTRDQIVSQIVAPKHGMMPAWEGRLDEATIRQLAIYVHSLGGGE